MVRRARRGGESLAQCYGRTTVSTAIARRVGIGGIKETFVARSPVHFERGDMRRAYGWTRTILTAAAVALALGMSLRVLLTGLFVAFITSELLPVIVFNVCVSVLVGRWLLREVRIHPPRRRQESRRKNYRLRSLSSSRLTRSSAIDRL